ncbi:MAG TPA: hypothetical protein VJ725_03760, partial [Thermoanaerobaculia bacterium]|nr:hypothetical protein [Thermoanaerobaculia bacterium]
LEKGLIDWDNYEAKFPYFPVQFQSTVRFPELHGILRNATLLRVRQNRYRIDAYYLWGMPPGHPLEIRLKRSYYRLVAKTGDGALYERRPVPPRKEAPRAGSARRSRRRSG